jgi:hypothetical protein
LKEDPKKSVKYKLKRDTEDLTARNFNDRKKCFIFVHKFNRSLHFFQGREVSAAEIAPVLVGLSSSQAEAVKQRVKALNRTVRGRQRNRSQRKPDIRDVFRDIDASSTGTRSRSATPDSLDSLPPDDHWGNNNHM